ncbi:methyl-CpG-binding domain-containing protein 13 [Iris pallida]|uniref:Methyl-CpG-binding domain-containing protein 13 n=1 Tax=Iris pallida TaxID=29817 RepID=A0AAX6F5F1_IRIPA|nr:methyl-CpG-binding domain-containing protein 13 [Iris pallida]
MGVKKASNRRRIAGIRRLLAEVTAEETPPLPSPPPSTPAAERPDWLPEDWKMEVKWRKDGERADRYYICPKSGKVLRSKPEVFRYLNPDSYPSSYPNRYLSSGKVENSLVPYFGGYTLGPSGGSKHLFAALEDYPLEWLPTGWLLEFGTWRNGVSEANNYKCYFDPLTGSRFYSKEAVLQYLEAHKPYPTSIQGGRSNANMKESSNMNCPQNVLTQIDYSPSGLPHGWVKEIRISKPKSSKKVRRDSIYIDTVSGYAFRSNKDAVRYLENKEICRLAFRLEESRLPKARFSTKESLAIAVRQPELKNDSEMVCYFSKKKKKSNKMIVAEISDPPHSPSSPSVYHASAESDDISKTTCSTLATFEQLREDGRLETESPAMPAFEREGFPEHPANKMEPEAANDRASDMQSVENKILDLDVTLRQFKMAKKKLQRKNRGRKCGPVLSNTQNKATTVDANRSGPSKRKAVKATTLPLRASKRIAGVEADPVSEFGNGEQPQRPKCSQPDEPQPTIAKDSDSSCEFHQKKGVSQLELPEIPDGMEPQVEQATMEQQANPSAEQAIKEQQANLSMEQDIKEQQANLSMEQATKEQQANPSMKLPFGDSWPDPSIEFAVKTLTGDIPVLEDTMALQEFFLRQLRSVQKLLPPGQSALVPSDGTPMEDDGKPSSSGNGKESKQCRQKFD